MLSQSEIELLNISSARIGFQYKLYKNPNKYMFVPMNFDEIKARVSFQDISYADDVELQRKLYLMFNETVAVNVMKSFTSFKELIKLDTNMTLLCNYNPVDQKYAGVKLILLDENCKHVA